MIIYIPPFLLAVMSLISLRMIRRRRVASASGAEEYPESMTAVLVPGAEEYLAWLADHHWPDDEYLDLERHWQADLEPIDAHATETCPVCPACRRPGHDVWPCPECGLLVHSGCGHGMRRRKIAKPYRTRDMDTESVIAEWICSRCASIVGLDVDRGDEETGHDLRQ